MKSRGQNIYKTCRKNAGLTQEEAAELLYVSVRSIVDYESGKTIPPDDVVMRMVEIYESTELAYLHLKYNTEVGRKYLPDLITDNFSTSVLRFQKEYQDITRIQNDMIEIACDGNIDSDEMDKWQKVKKEVSDVASAAMRLMFIG